MKKIIIIIGLAALLSMQAIINAKAQTQEVQQLLLDIQKLSELKKILKEMEQGYQIVSKGYSAISDLSKNNFNLHEVFLDGLLAVSPSVKNYYKVKEIIDDQVAIIKEYKRAFRLFKTDGHFSADEIGYISSVYNNLFHQSLDKLNELTIVITRSKLRMSDDERLAAIDRIDAAMQDKLNFLRSFDDNTMIQALQRAKASGDTKSLQALYGINK